MPDPDPIDCRSPSGVTIGLIDGIISIARVLHYRPMNDPAVVEALKDLRADECVRELMKGPDDATS